MPCFVYKENIPVDVDGIGSIPVDVAYCSAFYVYLDVRKVGLEVTENTERLVKVGMEIKNKVMAKMNSTTHIQGQLAVRHHTVRGAGQGG